ncbi:MAG: septal ring lytic transglycosylase RlpA family protein [Nitrospirota bacterium]
MGFPFAHSFGIVTKSLLAVLLAGMVVISCGGKKAPGVKEPGKQKATQKPYTVLGKRYEPLKTHVGFSQEGIASWYGKDFHGKKTSNGEVYDMHAMTAAHKTLPLGVFVRVRNRDNGQETVVRVNDRGPFVKNRIIDLSYSAAKKLGVDVKGTAPVRIEALGYKSSGEGYQAPENYDSGNFSVQIGSFKDQQNAKRLSEEMKKLHGYSEVKTAVVNGEQFYRVQAGVFTSLQAAEEAEQRFADQGYPGSFAVALD